MPLLLFVLILLLPAVSQAIERHIAPGGSDSGSCIPASLGGPGPCATFNYARTQVASGDTLYFRAGSYGSIVINGENPIANGTDNANRTTIAGYPGETVDVQEIDFRYNSCQGPGFDQPSCGVSQYITVRNFRLLGNGISLSGCGYANHAPVMYGCGAHFIRIEQIERSNPDQPGACIGSGHGSSDLEFVDIHVHHCGLNIPYTGGSPPTHGFYTCSPNTVYDRIHSHDNAGYGIQHYESFWDTSTGYTAFGCGNDVTIRNSYIHDNGRLINYGGIIMADGHRMKVYNNVIVNNNGDGLGWVYSLDAGHLDDVETYNNTIYGNTGWGLTLGNPPPSTTELRNPITRNNIVYGNSGGTSNIRERVATSPTYSNNLCNSLTTGCTRNGAPVFDDTGAGTAEGFKIGASSDAHNTGTALTLFTTDKEGNARNQGGVWDIGAYEYPDGGGVEPTGNPIYIAATGGTPTTNCITAENPATPIRTIQDGLACMNTTAGKRMIVKAGTYTECIDTMTQPIKGGNGPSYSDATTIETFGTDLVTLRPTSCPSGAAIFFQNGAQDSYILIKGSAANRLVIDGLNVQNSLVFYPSVHHLRFEFVEVKNSATFEGIFGLNTTNIEFVDSLIHHNKTHGIGLSGGNSNWLLQRTMVYNNGTTTGHGGFFQKDGSTDGLNIRESTVKSNTGDGIVIGTGTGATIINSLVYTNGARGLQLQSGSSGAKIYNSTFYGNTGNGFQCDVGASAVEVKNTIVFGNIAGNLVNNCTATVAKNLCATVSASCEFGGDPLFVNAAAEDFHLANGSPGINTGTPITSNTTDYYGAIRPQGAYDIGHGERDQVPPTDPDTTTLKAALWQRGLLY